jgi:hypothetical protein
VIVGGLTLFGGCLSLTGMAELEQLHTAIPFGEGELSDELRKKLADTSPTAGVSNLISGLTLFFAVTLTFLGMGLLQHVPKVRSLLVWWSILYIILSLCSAVVNWLPRLALMKENSEVQGMFLAQLLISLPMYLVLPIFLIVYLNTNGVKSETGTWR